MILDSKNAMNFEGKNVQIKDYGITVIGKVVKVANLEVNGWIGVIDAVGNSYAIGYGASIEEIKEVELKKK
jgi:hypothetical protein